MPLTNAEVFVIMYFRGMDLSNQAVQEILHLKIHHLSTVAQGNVSHRVTHICNKEQKEGFPALRNSSGAWNRSALDDFMLRKASGLSDDEQRYLTQIGGAEQEIIDRDAITKRSKRHRDSEHDASRNGPAHRQSSKASKRHKDSEHDASRNGPAHRQSSKASAFPPAYTTGFTPINQYQPHEMTHVTDLHSPRRPRHELSPPRSHHYQTSNSSTATNFQSPYGPSGYNNGRLIDNQPAYNSAIYGEGRTNTGPPFQSPDYPYAAPTSHSDYHAGWSDKGGERRSTRPTETLGYPPITPRPKGPLAPGGRNDIYF